MKEIQMFPQITEETEENLLTLDELDQQQLHQQQQQIQQQQEGKTSPSPVSSVYSSAVTSPVDGVLPSPAGLEEPFPPVPKIVAEDVDFTASQKTKANNAACCPSSPPPPPQDEVNRDEFSSPPPRVRMRSLSGGTYRLSPAPPASNRMRRQSGDDVLTGVSPSRRPAFLDAFRPRSKSDSKSKKPTFLNTFLRNSIFSNQQQDDAEKQQQKPASTILPPSEYRQRSRSGSEARSGPMSKVMDMFRSRSNSIAVDQRNKNFNSAPQGSAFMRRRSLDPERRRHPLSSTQRSLGFWKRSETIQGVENEFHMYRNLDSVYSEENPLVIPMFFDAWRCNHVMPLSGKVVILEVNLKVEKAFYSLVENAMRAAPVWSSAKMEFIGMLTITDFIDVLLYYSSKEEMGDFENQKICNWRSITNKNDKFVHISPDASLTEAVKLLVKEKVHRLPIFDSKTQSVLYILTHKRILKYFYHVGLCNNRIGSIFPKPSFFLKSIGELKLGTYENIALADCSMTVIEALKIFHERRVSALPVVENGVLVDVYAKFDAFALATEKAYCNLSMTLKQALQERGEYHEPVLTCTLDDVLHSVLERIIESEVHRVVVVSPKNAVLGIISLSDILKFLVLKPLGMSNCESPGVVEQNASELHAKQEGLESSTNNELAFQQQTVHTDDESIPFAEASDDDDVFSENHHGKDNVLNMNCSASSHVVVKEETLEEALDSLVIPEIS